MLTEVLTTLWEDPRQVPNDPNVLRVAFVVVFSWFLEVMNVLCCRFPQVISSVVLYVAVDDFLTLFIAWWTLVVPVVTTGRGRIMRMFLGPGQKVRGLSMLWNGSGRMTASLYVLDSF